MKPATFMIALGLTSIGLGLKGFTAQGLPLTRERNLTGAPAKITGVLCVVFGFGLMMVMPVFWVLGEMESRTETRIDNQRASVVANARYEPGPSNMTAVQEGAVNAASGKGTDDPGNRLTTQVGAVNAPSGQRTNK